MSANATAGTHPNMVHPQAGGKIPNMIHPQASEELSLLLPSLADPKSLGNNLVVAKHVVNLDAAIHLDA
uniref:Uncharacterized protein n=1 Tax=Fagus sylvatica TaxID=28930 RepID=A0A2N9FNW2_FAGSY